MLHYKISDQMFKSILLIAWYFLINICIIPSHPILYVLKYANFYKKMRQFNLQIQILFV